MTALLQAADDLLDRRIPVARLERSRPKGIFAMLKRDIALARAELKRLDKAIAARARHEAATASDVRYRQMADRLETDQRRWRRAPDLFRDALGSTWQGALVLARIWAAMLEALAPDGPGLSLELVHQAMMANGSPWKVHQANPDGWWIMARYLAEQPQREQQVTLWIKKSRDVETDIHHQRANHYLSEVLYTGDPLEELRSRAQAQADHWSAEAARLQSAFEAEVENAAQNLAGTGLGDRFLTQEARILMTNRKNARDYLAKLEKRLDTLRKNRQQEMQKTNRLFEKLPRSCENRIIHSRPTELITYENGPNSHPEPSRPNATSAPVSPLTSAEQEMLDKMHLAIHQPVQADEISAVTRKQHNENAPPTATPIKPKRLFNRA